ncbi:hypothetical protein N752_06080 [Desulforamulus aquiferis]|nr:DUF1538 family protein [Desulforamulus aquiferis]RYD06094.1 hypothetical protein N752_06080 [Desulforamulus aquiferis]
MSELIIFKGLDHVLVEVAAALLPLFIIFLVFQFFFLQLPKEKVIQITSGMGLAFIGLSLFLQGVHIGFSQQEGQWVSNWASLTITGLRYLWE